MPAVCASGYRCRVVGDESGMTRDSTADPGAPGREGRLRLRDLGLTPGVLPVGPRNDITDVVGVRVGHSTLVTGDDVRTGVTAVLAHGDNPFRERVPAGLVVGNGFGKLIGATQVVELGELETPIVLTNTLSVARAADALIGWMLELPGNGAVRSVNPFVGETNDGYLNDIRARVVTAEHVVAALEGASDGPVTQGAVGAGTGTVAFGFKGGIGSSSRRLPERLGAWTVGALVQSNFGGVLQVAGVPVGERLGRYYLREELSAGVGPGADPADGSIMIVLSTDAPLSSASLTRLASRGLAGLARTGAAMSDGSGDYAVAFSTHEGVRRSSRLRGRAAATSVLGNGELSPLFLAAIEAVEEAIYDSLCLAITTRGFRGRVVEAVPLGALRGLGVGGVSR